MKREPRWVPVFLKHLERSGNVRLAAEGAGVDYTTAYQRRKRHGAFAERWEGALRLYGSQFAQDEREGDTPPSPCGAAACPPDRLNAASTSSSPSSPPKGGEDYVARPDGKLIRASEARWSPRKEEKFLLELTMSGSVKLAAKAAGFSTAALYKRRLKDKRFAAAWEAAVETGKARVQAYLVEAATRTFDPDELPIGEAPELPNVSIGEAINIARLQHAGGRGRGGKDSHFDGWEADHEEYRDACERIIERLERMSAQREAEERRLGCCSSCGQPLPAERPGG